MTRYKLFKNTKGMKYICKPNDTKYYTVAIYDYVTLKYLMSKLDKYNIDVNKVSTTFKHFAIFVEFKYYDKLELKKILRYLKVFYK